jgi:hypothetical protein
MLAMKIKEARNDKLAASNSKLAENNAKLASYQRKASKQATQN